MYVAVVRLSWAFTFQHQICRVKVALQWCLIGFKLRFGIGGQILVWKEFMVQ